ncbi:unnamed protein product [Pedinophyceae sp. YPF-701]|nr:unnamed protein product [Pedinophyceae sp. YPF-701]
MAVTIHRDGRNDRKVRIQSGCGAGSSLWAKRDARGSAAAMTARSCPGPLGRSPCLYGSVPGRCGAVHASTSVPPSRSNGPGTGPQTRRVRGSRWGVEPTDRGGPDGAYTEDPQFATQAGAAAMRAVRAAALLCCALLLGVPAAAAERSLRQDSPVCSALASLRRDGVRDDSEVAGLLRGVTLRLGVIEEPPYTEYVREGGEFRGAAGYTVDVLEAVAARGGFTYEMVPLDESRLQAGEETYTELLARTIAQNDFDVLASNWYSTAERQRLGVLFGRRVIDSSGYVVAPKNDVSNEPPLSEKLGLFAQPFSGGVWATIVGLLIFQATVMFFLDRQRVKRVAREHRIVVEQLRHEARKDDAARQGHMCHTAGAGPPAAKPLPGATLSMRWNNGWADEASLSRDDAEKPTAAQEVADLRARLAWVDALAQSAFETVSHMAQAEDAPMPVAWAARVQNVVWCFLVLLTISAYTANLATFLIVRSQPESSINGIGDLLGRRIPTCVQFDTGLGEFVSSKYPSLNSVRSRWSDGIDNVEANRCTAIIMALYDAQLALTSGAGCSLAVQGQPLVDLGGAWAYSPSSEAGCGPQVMVVMDSLLAQLSEEGVMAELWEPYVQRQCAADLESEGASASNKVTLSLDGFSGPFLVYGCATFLLICCSIIGHWREQDRGRGAGSQEADRSAPALAA